MCSLKGKNYILISLTEDSGLGYSHSASSEGLFQRGKRRTCMCRSFWLKKTKINHVVEHQKIMLLLSRFGCVWLCVTPQTAAHQASPSLGFSRQKHWSGLPFPSPMRESEVVQSCPTLATPWTAAYQAPPSMGFSRQKYWSRVPVPSPKRL